MLDERSDVRTSSAKVVLALLVFFLIIHALHNPRLHSNIFVVVSWPSSRFSLPDGFFFAFGPSHRPQTHPSPLTQVWSLGCLLYAIAFHRSPFDLPDTNLGGSIALSVISGKYEIPASSRFSKGFLALIAAMLQVWSHLQATHAHSKPFIGSTHFISNVISCLRISAFNCACVCLVFWSTLPRALWQSRIEDRPFVPAIAGRVEAMLREHGVSVNSASANGSGGGEFDSDDEKEAFNGGSDAGGRVKLDLRS